MPYGEAHISEKAMCWHLVHTKPRQEKCALHNLEQQGFQCYLPVRPVERIRQSVVAAIEEPLFPRYIFVRLGAGDTAKSWAPIRSTKGVSRLVCFGVEPARVSDSLIEVLRANERALMSAPVPLFEPGDRIEIVTDGAFSGIEGVFQMSDGDHRAMVLIELLSRPVSLPVPFSALRKTG